MSRRIAVLSEEVANQIAAGEVVERPASIVKELVENAVDAGARDIRVEIEKGGCRFIRVSDNGFGIEREDVALVFERHATSKIVRIDDIYDAGSFGFRGEAMASIASVARVELLTRRADDLAGTRALVEAGTISEIAPAGVPPGTQITVTELFANVPARRKFLKTEATEQSACLDAVTRLALAHPEIRFSVRADGRSMFAAPAAAGVADRVAMILGKDFTEHSLTIAEHKENVELRGFISTPAWTKSNSKNVFWFVNSRFIRDNSMMHALLSAYRQVMEPRRFPAAVLFLRLPGEEVDINVHPAKLEVRFKNSRGIYDLVSGAVSRALAGAQASRNAVAYRLTPRETTSASSGFWRSKPYQASSDKPHDLFSRQNPQRSIGGDLFARAGEPDVPAYIGEADGEERITFDHRTYLGQFAGTYLVFGSPGGLMLLDQHAAHERILLERLKASEKEQAASQPLLMPEVVTLTPAQISLLTEALPLLAGIGLELDVFGRDAVVVKAVPVALPNVEPRQLVSDLVDQLSDGQGPPSLAERKEKILASLACHAAVKAHADLSADEVAALCRDLEKTPFNATCPHGRPIRVQFTLYEIERLFKRK